MVDTGGGVGGASTTTTRLAKGRALALMMFLAACACLFLDTKIVSPFSQHNETSSSTTLQKEKTTTSTSAVENESAGASTSKHVKKENKQGKKRTSESSDFDSADTTLKCTWSPSKQDECHKLLLKKILYNHKHKQPPLRWLFFGDSTVAQMWEESSLRNILVDLPIQIINRHDDFCYNDTTLPLHLACQERQISEQCQEDLHHAYGLSMPDPDLWIYPNVSQMEGPSVSSFVQNDSSKFKLCLGCHHCQSNFVLCHPQEQEQEQEQSTMSASTASCSTNSDIPPLQLLHGGYFVMTFARDVLLQTPHYRTSQEALLLDYIANHFNLPSIQNSFGGKPICVARAGFHDMALPGANVQQFVQNVVELIQLLLQQCAHVVWLQNTAPLQPHDYYHDDNRTTTSSRRIRVSYRQTVERVRQYNEAVYTSLLNYNGSHGRATNSTISSNDITIMDVFEASIDWPHQDNIHLNEKWNRALGKFVLKVATKMAQT